MKRFMCVMMMLLTVLMTVGAAGAQGQKVDSGVSTTPGVVTETVGIFSQQVSFGWIILIAVLAIAAVLVTIYVKNRQYQILKAGQIIALRKVLQDNELLKGMVLYKDRQMAVARARIQKMQVNVDEKILVLSMLEKSGLDVKALIESGTLAANEGVRLAAAQTLSNPPQKEEGGMGGSFSFQQPGDNPPAGEKDFR